MHIYPKDKSVFFQETTGAGSKSKVHLRLYKDGQKHMARAKGREAALPSGCTFKPAKIAASLSESRSDVTGKKFHERLHNYANERLNRRDEMHKQSPRGCTFMPSINKKYDNRGQSVDPSNVLNLREE